MESTGSFIRNQPKTAVDRDLPPLINITSQQTIPGTWEEANQQRQNDQKNTLPCLTINDRQIKTKCSDRERQRIYKKVVVNSVDQGIDLKLSHNEFKHSNENSETISGICMAKRQSTNQNAALQTGYKLTVMLTGCHYDIFKRLCLQELNYRVIVPGVEQESNVQVVTINKQTNQQQSIAASQLLPKELQWEIWWQDFGIQPDFLSTLLPFQRVNHFLGMYNIARKNTLGIHLRRFQKVFGKQYNFFPHTWLYPADSHEILEYNARKYKKRNEQIASGLMTQEQSNADPPIMFIVKPEAGCQGKGIFIARKIEELQQRVDSIFKKQNKEFDQFLKEQEQYDTAKRYGVQQLPDATSIVTNDRNQTLGDGQEIITQAPTTFYKEHSYVVQKYIKHPALWKDHKFDFRIYVLITTVIDPMTIFLYKDGLVRLASEKYSGSKNMSDVFVHLTNYSLNKKNGNFDNDKHKLKVSDCLKGTMTQPSYKPGKPGASRTAESIWEEIESIVVKTVLTVQPQLQHIYRSCQSKDPDCCFELLGFDIMLDAKLKPWMIEVNHTPSFNSDTGVDEQIKSDLLKDTFEIIQLSVEQGKAKDAEIRQEKKQQEIQGSYKRMTAKEHCDRVRFDPKLVNQRFPNSGYRLIYPKQAPGEDPDIYQKIQVKGEKMWKVITGTVTQQRPSNDYEKPRKSVKRRKKKQQKKKRGHKNKIEEVEDAENGSSQEDDEGEDESSWAGGPQAEEQAVKEHLQQQAIKEQMKQQIVKESQLSQKVAENNRQEEKLEKVQKSVQLQNEQLVTKRTSSFVPFHKSDIKSDINQLTPVKVSETETNQLHCACSRQSPATTIPNNISNLRVFSNHSIQSSILSTDICQSCGGIKLTNQKQPIARPSISLSCQPKKVIPKREPLKLATVGAVVGSQVTTPPPSKMQLKDMEQNLKQPKVYKSNLNKSNQLSKLGYTEQEILQAVMEMHKLQVAHPNVHLNTQRMLPMNQRQLISHHKQLFDYFHHQQNGSGTLNPYYLKGEQDLNTLQQSITPTKLSANFNKMLQINPAGRNIAKQVNAANVEEKTKHQRTPESKSQTVTSFMPIPVQGLIQTATSAVKMIPSMQRTQQQTVEKGQKQNLKITFRQLLEQEQSQLQSGKSSACRIIQTAQSIRQTSNNSRVKSNQLSISESGTDVQLQHKSPQLNRNEGKPHQFVYVQSQQRTNSLLFQHRHQQKVKQTSKQTQDVITQSFDEIPQKNGVIEPN